MLYQLQLYWQSGDILEQITIVSKHLSYTAISIKVVHEQSGKVEYERERLLWIANLINEFSKRFPAAFRGRIRLFCFARGQP
jgi:hypothetical protein